MSEKPITVSLTEREFKAVIICIANTIEDETDEQSVRAMSRVLNKINSARLGNRTKE